LHLQHSAYTKLTHQSTLAGGWKRRAGGWAGEGVKMRVLPAQCGWLGRPGVT